MIAIEFPEGASSHPDLEFEWHVEYYIHPSTGERKEAVRDHGKVWMMGCKTCQQTLSECGCGSKRVVSRVLLYERGEKFGDEPLKNAFLRFFRFDEKGTAVRIAKEEKKQCGKQ